MRLVPRDLGHEGPHRFPGVTVVVSGVTTHSQLRHIAVEVALLQGLPRTELRSDQVPRQRERANALWGGHVHSLVIFRDIRVQRHVQVGLAGSQHQPRWPPVATRSPPPARRRRGTSGVCVMRVSLGCNETPATLSPCSRTSLPSRRPDRNCSPMRTAPSAASLCYWQCEQL